VNCSRGNEDGGYQKVVLIEGEVTNLNAVPGFTIGDKSRINELINIRNQRNTFQCDSGKDPGGPRVNLKGGGDRRVRVEEGGYAGKL